MDWFFEYIIGSLMPFFELNMIMWVKIIEHAPYSMIPFMALMISLEYIRVKVFVHWTQDFRCWRAGGIGRSSLKTSDFYLNRNQC